MAVLSNSGISSGSIVETTHITQIIDAFTGVQEYDITLSGSLTLTGSLNFDTIPNNIQGTSSTSTTSSYSILSTTSSFASTSSTARNETVLITFTHSPINLVTGSMYYLGGSHITTAKESSGLAFINRHKLQHVTITAISATTGSGFTCGVAILKNFTKVYDFVTTINYNRPITLTKQYNINLNIVEGDIISFRLEPSNTGILPTRVVHNIQLYSIYA